MSEHGEKVARLLGSLWSSDDLRLLAQQITDPEQREIVMSAYFETMSAVDQLGFIGEFGRSPRSSDGNDDART